MIKILVSAMIIVVSTIQMKKMLQLQMQQNFTV